MKLIPHTFSLLILMCLSCSEHPFGEEKIASGNRTISGRVMLSDSLNPAGVYVWLESFNLGTFTDPGGKFTLTLPMRELQGASRGVSGAFRLYFFLANYFLALSYVATVNGEFLYSQGEFDENGVLKKPKELEKFLHVVTTFTPARVTLDSLPLLFVETKLETIEDTVTVFFPAKGDGLSGPIILKRIDSEKFFIFPTRDHADLPDDILHIEEEPYIRRVVVNLNRGPSLPPGRYEMIPFFFIFHQTIPTELLETLGGSALRRIDEGYLNIPMRRQSDTLTVIP